MIPVSTGAALLDVVVVATVTDEIVDVAIEVVPLDIVVVWVVAVDVFAEEDVVVVEGTAVVVDVATVVEVVVAVTGFAFTKKVIRVEVARFPARSRATAKSVYVPGVRVVVVVKGALMSSVLSF